MPHFQSALLICAFGLLCGCGQTGPLVLPNEQGFAEQPTTEQNPSSPSTSSKP